MTYYNTTQLETKQHDLAMSNASMQDFIVMTVFHENNKPMSPSDVHKKAFGDNTPLTSTRRSISNLTKSGFLFKTPAQKRGVFGKPEYLWELV